VFQKQVNPMMRSLPLAFVFSALVLFPGSLFAGDARPHQPAAITVKAKTSGANPRHETYRGYYSDLSAIADRKDFSELADGLRHQIDIVESSGLSSRVLQFFQTMPIVIDDFACVGNMTASTSGELKPMMGTACYSRHVPENMQDKNLSASVWDSEKGWPINIDPLMRARLAHTGVVMFRPSTLAGRDRERPVLLHELLHAYHDHILPGGFANPVALSWFKQTTDKQVYPADQYLMTNEKEFFAVTASVFLFGRDGAFTRSNIKEKQPDYYQYLVWLFQFDPDRTSSVPVALAN
jgi:hypothetical protein